MTRCSNSSAWDLRAWAISLASGMRIMIWAPQFFRMALWRRRWSSTWLRRAGG